MKSAFCLGSLMLILSPSAFSRKGFAVPGHTYPLITSNFITCFHRRPLTGNMFISPFTGFGSCLQSQRSGENTRLARTDTRCFSRADFTENSIDFNTMCSSSSTWACLIEPPKFLISLIIFNAVL